MKLQEVTGYNLQSKTILNEGWEVLTESQRLHVSAWEKRVWPLMEQLNVLLEAELTTDQIQKIFTSAEQVANATGNNRTALGKAGDVTKEVSTKIKAEIDKLIKQAADSEPVKNMDAQFDKLRAQLATKVKDMPGGSKILAGVDKWKGFAQENPAKSAFIVGAMTSILAFASGGIMSGAAIGFFLRLANNTIKGDKLSTAVGKSVKGAAIGAVAGAIGDVVSDNINVDPPAEKGGAAEIKVSVDSEEVADAAGSEEGTDTSELLSGMTEDEYKLKYAERIASTIGYSGGMEDAMIQKIADNLTTEGTYPNDFKINFEGTVVRGNIYLTPDELAQWQSFIKPDDPFAPNGTMGKETTQWLKDNVEGVEEQFAAEEAERAARLEKAKANYDAMSAEEQKAYDDKQRQKYGDFLGDPDEYTPPGEPKYDTGNSDTGDNTDVETGAGYTSENGIKYTDEEINKIVSDAKEQGVTPGELIDTLLDTKDIDPGVYSDEVIGLEQAIKELGYSPTKVPESLEEQLWSAFEQYQLNEAPNFAAAMSGAAKGIGKVAAKGADAVSKVAAKGAEKAGSAINTAKSDLGNKVTANKLMRTWKKAGSPTDMGSIVNILSGAGIPDSQIGTVGKQAKIPLEKPTAPAVDVKSLAAEIQQAGVADIVKQMLSKAPAQPKTNAPAFNKEKFRARADRARTMKAKPVRSDMYTDTENTDA